jgi:hypothetical protein
MKKLALITTILLAVLTVATSTTGAHDVERDALMALYNSTDGANWDFNNGWGTEEPHCNWYGVSCSAGKVTFLQMFGNQLTGPIPPELDKLTSLLFGWVTTN